MLDLRRQAPPIESCKLILSTGHSLFYIESATGAGRRVRQLNLLSEEDHGTVNEYLFNSRRREEKCQEKVTHLREKFFLILYTAA
jgi:hypothetical protein